MQSFPLYLGLFEEHSRPSRGVIPAGEAEADEPEWRLLLVDGAVQHVNDAHYEWCRQHRIIMFQLPAHTTDK